MKDSDQDSKRIPKEQMTAWERWELPLLDERGNQVVEEEEVKPLTAADLEEKQRLKEEGLLVNDIARARLCRGGTPGSCRGVGRWGQK